MGFAATLKEDLKLLKNGLKCKELRWECIPLALEEMYGGWGEKAWETFEHTCKRLAVGSSSREVMVRQELFGRLSLTLMRENTHAILARSNWSGCMNG